MNVVHVTINDAIVNEFLNGQKKSTANTYKSHIQLYLKFTEKTGQQLLDDKKSDKDFQVENSIFSFRKWLLEKGYSEKYTSTCIGCVRGFYAYFRVPLVFRKQESKKLTSAQRTTTDYLFDKEDLAKMALVGNLKERYVLLVGKSVGLRASDFLTLTYGTFRSLKLDNDAPIGLGQINTIKESVPAFPFLDSDSIPIVKQMLDSNKDAKDSDKILNDSEDNLSVILQTLAKKAGIEPHGKRIRFHNLRKFLIDHLSAYASESQWKQICGKSISEGAYVSQDQLQKIYARAMPSMLINGNGVKAKKLMELENALVESQKRLTALETTNEVLRKKMEDQDCKMTELGDNLSGIGEAITELQHKHPDITMADLTAIKQPLENAIKDINGKMDLVISFLEKNQGFKPTKQ